MLEAFLDGITGAGLFGRLNWPGAPTEFIDSRSVEEFLAREPFNSPIRPIVVVEGVFLSEGKETGRVEQITSDVFIKITH